MNPDVIEALRKFYTEETPISEGIHVAMRQYLNLYVAINPTRATATGKST